MRLCWLMMRVSFFAVVGAVVVVVVVFFFSFFRDEKLTVF